MSVPKAPVNEDRCLVFGQHKIGLSGELISMNSKAKTSAVQSFTNEDFGRGVFPLYPGHHPGAGCRVYYVGQENLHSGAPGTGLENNLFGP
jgi:hypothetical protein